MNIKRTPKQGKARKMFVVEISDDEFTRNAFIFLLAKLERWNEKSAVVFKTSQGKYTISARDLGRSTTFCGKSASDDVVYVLRRHTKKM
jgi:hypothetical protein